MKFCHLLWWGLLLSSVIPLPLKAQINPDGTTGTTTTSIDNDIRIDEGNRAGDNLFHSFEQFSVPNGSEAFFNNANDIVNIFSRVTGGDISNIDGLIRANGDANLFLINPAGIVFGEGASLDIGGSFFASSAESIVFGDNIEFSTTNSSNEPLLTINQPLGLNISNNPGDINVNGGNLQVNSGETLALIGGNITLTGGQIIAPGANIEIGGLTETGQISFTQSGDTFSSFNFPATVTRGDVILTNGAKVNVQAAGGGSIDINARNLELSGGELGASNLKAGIAPESQSTEAQAGDILIDAQGDVSLIQDSGISNLVEESGAGNGGAIEITTTNLSLSGGGRVIASTFGQGDAGVVTINASETITVKGETSESHNSGILSIAAGAARGNSGGIEMTTKNLSLSGGGVVSASTLGQGDAGVVTIDASDTVAINGEDRGGFNSRISSEVNSTGAARGNSGGIEMTTKNLSLSGGGVVSANTFGQGDAGVVTINASDTISIDGEDSDGGNSGIFSIVGSLSQVSSTGEGNSGGIEMTTTNLFLSGGGRVSTNTFGQGDAGVVTINASDTISIDGEDSDGGSSGISSQVGSIGEGNSGGIEMTTTNLFLSGGGVVSASTLGQGNAGLVTIDASDTVAIDGEDSDGGNSGILSIVAEAARGNSGGIEMTTKNLSLSGGGIVSASTLGQGNAGVITIDASDTVAIDGEDSDGDNSSILSIEASSGEGNAADIEINTSNLSLTDNAAISVQSLGQGEAGNLDIQANSLTLENEAALFASTPVGSGGSITLQIADELILRDNSTISAQALEDANGGNIDLEAQTVVAFPNQNNDIIANAARGDGGNINITTNALFGIAERSSLPANNTNDIDASSEFGLDGTVAINELDVNPAEELEELPAEVIDATRLVDQNLCQQGDQSEFIVTGKGGIAPNPSQVRDGEVSEVDLVEPANHEAGGRGEQPFALAVQENLRPPDEAKIVEAQGWMVNDRGILELVAHKTDANSPSPQPENIECPI